MKLISTTHDDRTTIIRLDRGVTNALSLELINELFDTLQDIEGDADTQNLILGSANDKFAPWDYVCMWLGWSG